MPAAGQAAATLLLTADAPASLRRGRLGREHVVLSALDQCQAGHGGRQIRRARRAEIRTIAAAGDIAMRRSAVALARSVRAIRDEEVDEMADRRRGTEFLDQQGEAAIGEDAAAAAAETRHDPWPEFQRRVAAGKIIGHGSERDRRQIVRPRDAAAAHGHAILQDLDAIARRSLNGCCRRSWPLR